MNGAQASTSFAGGKTVSGTVSFLPGWVAPPGGSVVKLGSTNPSLVQVPSQVTIPAGASSADFTVTTSAVTQVTKVTVLGSRSLTIPVVLELLQAGALETMTLSPTTVTGGNP